MYTVEHMPASHVQADYNQLITFSAIGKLDVEVLKTALTFMWRRHQALRTALIFQVPWFLGLLFMAVTQLLHD